VGTQVSVVMPAYNECPNLAELVPQTLRVLHDAGVPCEVIVVDDGSSDGTPQLMEQLATPELVALRLRRNAGKSAALSVGLARAKGEYIVLMDADGQDDPDEIPRLLAVLRGGDPDSAGDAIGGAAIADNAIGGAAVADNAIRGNAIGMVTGRRAERNDRSIKRVTSRLYNRVTSLVTGVPGRDFNSGLKVMRREVAQGLDLYGELHRYLPVLAQWRGFRVHEVDVRHHSRRHGASKFGRARFWRGFLDLMTVKFLTTYTARPFHLFGGLGLLMGLAGSGLLIWMLVSWSMGQAVGTRPALLTGVLLVVVAVQMTFFGLLAELIVHLRRQRDLDAAIEVDEL
jgi:glycosyltransferase involved in cell wall biosynthesis